MCNKRKIIQEINNLYNMWKTGQLGGEVMPEDVIYQYTDRKYKNMECLTVAPDTHVVQATHRLGVINDK